MDAARARAAWIAPARAPAAGARVRLLCIPHAGAGAAHYRAWRDALPPRVDLHLAQLPGREGRFAEPPAATMRDAVVPLADALLAQPGPPVVLFGHSMGGLIAFELARELRRRRAPMPLHLLVAAHRAPHLPYPRAPLRHLPDARLRDALAAFGGTPREVLDHPELLDLVIPTLRADLALCETYHHASEPPLDLPLTAYGGHDDALVPTGDLDAWRRHTTAPFRLRMLPGDHFLFHTPRAHAWDALRADLAAIADEA